MTAIASPYGTHRVIEPLGVLPQGAWKIDNTMALQANEILIDVVALNVDAASFTQIKAQAEGDPARVAQIVLDIVAQRGKLHNPVTGSGGMLIGRVQQIGAALQGTMNLRVGERIATLVSLSLTPLVISRIRAVHLDRDQIEVDGQAVLFETGLYARLPDDIAQTTAAGADDYVVKPLRYVDLLTVVAGITERWLSTEPGEGDRT